MSPRDAARGIALGRVALGAGLLLAPAAIGRLWVGAVADRAGTQVVLRGFGARDLVLGGIALHLAGRGPAGARALQACALVDAVDAAATLAQRRDLPPVGATATAAFGAGAAAIELAVARALRR
jgi:hypothetical protein